MTIMENVPRTDEEEDVDLTTEGTWQMDPSLKQRWVTALRSGKYKQGEAVFKKGDRYCALGVLLEVAGEPLFHEDGISNYDFVRSATHREPHDFYEKNDDGWTFEELADWIEENVA